MSRFSHYSGGQSISMEPMQPGVPPAGAAVGVEKPIDFSSDFRGVVVKSGSEDYNDHDYYQEDYVEENEEEGNGLRRQLKGRHISVSGGGMRTACTALVQSLTASSCPSVVSSVQVFSLVRIIHLGLSGSFEAWSKDCRLLHLDKTPPLHSTNPTQAHSRRCATASTMDLGSSVLELAGT